MLGRKIEESTVLNEHFNEYGKIILYEEGFELKNDRSNIKGGYNLIKDLESIGGVSLGRVVVKIHAFDMLGDEHKMVIALPEQIYLILKSKWEKIME
ncbi:hypothetical protein KO465_02550 [Candidatus Micrarchaeota archaeon]|jgi:hypothetical protein|nr:hypothetical protein [Candidatus Micrarchaeota archaeon]